MLSTITVSHYLNIFSIIDILYFSALFVVYDYHPGSQTLAEVHFKPRQQVYQHSRLQPQVERVPEKTVWSYFYQIASAIKTVHDAGLAVRSMDISNIIVTGQNR